MFTTSSASSNAFLWQALTVLNRQTRLEVRVINVSIFLICLWLSLYFTHNWITWIFKACLHVYKIVRFYAAFCPLKMRLGATTLSLTTLSIMTLGIIGLIAMPTKYTCNIVPNHFLNFQRYIFQLPVPLYSILYTLCLSTASISRHVRRRLSFPNCIRATYTCLNAFTYPGQTYLV